MRAEPLSLAVFTALLQTELSRIEDQAALDLARAALVPPYPKHLIWRTDDNAVYRSWVFAEFDGQKTGAVYCDRGAMHRDAQWGLVDLRSEYFGPEAAWFASVGALCAARLRRGRVAASDKRGEGPGT